jgi:hypothetical protein
MSHREMIAADFFFEVQIIITTQQQTTPAPEPIPTKLPSMALQLSFPYFFI